MLTVTNYSGFCAGRRAVTPPPTGGLLAWYDFSDASKLTLSGTLISTASDKSGNNLNAVAISTSTVTAKPVYTTAGQNGLSVADFTANGGTGPGLLAPGTFDFSAGIAMAMVAKYASTDANDSVMVYADPLGTGNQGFLQIHEQSATVSTASINRNLYAFSQGGAQLQPGTYAGNNYRIYSFFMRSGTKTANVDGGKFNVGTNGAYTGYTVTQLLVGKPLINPSNLSSFKGPIGEIRLFNAALTLSDLNKEEGYLAWKWGLVSNLPANHPYKNAPP